MFSYCAAIRTLGYAGEKYRRELESLVKQTIPPEHIFVYIAEGYPLPHETVGQEEYIRVPKGMVSQRALPYNEIDTPYILILDDDVYLEPDAVEKLFHGMQEMDGDCIAADTFANHRMCFVSKVKAAISNWAFPRRNDSYAFKVQHNASFTYNNNPDHDIYCSESAAGPASLWRLDALKNIHFEDEKWIDRIGFAYGDDLLFFYKLSKNGGRLLVHYNCGIVHLDAKSERKKYDADSRKLLLRSQMWFILWWRTCYDLTGISVTEKFLSMLSFSAKFLWNTITISLYSLIKLKLTPIKYHLAGTWKGIRYVHSPEYKAIPNFILHQ